MGQQSRGSALGIGTESGWGSGHKDGVRIGLGAQAHGQDGAQGSRMGLRAKGWGQD